MTHEELMRFKKDVADPAMRKIFARTEIPEGMCCIDKVNIEFLDGRSCGVDSLIEAAGFKYCNGRVQEYQYSETDVSVAEFAEEHKGCVFICDGQLRVFDELDKFEINTGLSNGQRCAKVFEDLKCLEELDYRLQSMEYEKMKAILAGDPLVKDGQGNSQEVPSARRATNIEWDVDSEEDLEGLPTEIEIPEWVEDEEISDYLSEVTGYCHKGYVLDEVAFVKNRGREDEAVTLQNAAAIEYKGIIFDDWTVDEENQSVWGEMCQDCADKYMGALFDELSEGGNGACSVKGCDVVGADSDNERHYYVDFKPELIRPLSKEQLAELQGKSLEHQICGAEAIGSKKEIDGVAIELPRPER